jgi:hypothetical protein
MAIKTSRVARRRLRFNSLDELRAEVERLAAAPRVQTLGNWSLGQILQHLAATMEMSLSGSDYTPPWLVRVLAKPLKQRFLTKPMRAGFKLPRALAARLVAADSTTTAAGLAAFRQALDRLQTDSHRERHNVFGELTRDEWDQLHLRHAELHLSFVAPEEASQQDA